MDFLSNGIVVRLEVTCLFFNISLTSLTSCAFKKLLREGFPFYLRGFKVCRRDITGPGEKGVCTLIRSQIWFTIVDIEKYSHVSLMSLLCLFN